MNKLAALAGLSASMFSSSHRPEQRIEALRHFFEPTLGSELKLNTNELNNLAQKSDPLNAKGFVMVSPPPHRCFVIRRSAESKDEYVCKRTQLSFRLRDLQYNGRLLWQVFTGKDDIGSFVYWETPYRLAQLVGPGKMFKESIPRYIISCQPQDGPQRQVKVTTMLGEEWTIRFPEYDQMMPQPEEGNLFIKTTEEKTEDLFSREKSERMSSQKSGDADKSEPQAAIDEPPSTVEYDPDEFVESDKDKKASLFTAVARKRHFTRIYHWNITPRNTYKMEAINFVTAGSPSTEKGACRYRFKGAPFDKSIGAVECIFAESFDAIIVPLTCVKDWQPRPPPEVK